MLQKDQKCKVDGCENNARTKMMCPLNIIEDLNFMVILN